MKRIVTMQDLSCIGKCSLTVALPVLSAMGLECAVLPTAVLSAHTAFEGFRYEPLSLTPVADHWQQLGLQFDMIYTGYLGGRAQVDQALDFFTRFPAMRLVDPVMADHGALYAGLEPDFPAVLRTLCAQADLITPNITEACLLTGTPYREEVDEGFARELLRGVAALGAKKVILTGVSFAPDKLGAMGYDSGAGTYFTCLGPRNPASFHGTGDIFAAVVTGGLMRGMTLEQAASLAVEFVLACIDATARDPQAGWYGVEFEKALPLLCERVRDLPEN